ncbi:hypothetical protein [Rhodococcus qingshengii]|uniref:hypothetical protein n=1 Tax=Rhodococcus qingshengii TaxID=334542 RepID=UPI0035E3021C
MANRVQEFGEKYIQADSGLGFTRHVTRKNVYLTDFQGVKFELEKRRRSPGDTPTTGWYLYSLECEGFFGEWCGGLLMEAIDAASDMILEADLSPYADEEVEVI